MIRSRRTKLRSGRLAGPDLARLRRDCYERDGRRCVNCGSHVSWDAMHMAHIKAKRRNGDSLGNVRTLCYKCHANEHNAGGKPVPAKEAACASSELTLD